MAIRSKAVEAGIIGPRHYEGESDGERETRASRIIGYFTTGVSDEVELRTLAKQPLGR